MKVDPTALLITAQAAAELTPEQRKYNQLVGKIAKSRAELLAWDEQASQFAQAHSERTRPLLIELSSDQLQFVRELEALLNDSRWTKAERRTVARTLCENAADLIESEFIDAEACAELEAMHDRHSDRPLGDARREEAAELKDMFEELAGIDLGDETFASKEELLRRAQERMRAEAAGSSDSEDATSAHPAGRPAARQSAAQRKRQAEQEQASQSVREVFRKLASALHPDRASDADDRNRRTALMQRVNQAYATQNLLDLFALQLEIEQVDAAHLASAGNERMRHYNRVLAAQLADLQEEVESRRAEFGAQFRIEPGRRVDPRKLGPFLEEDVRRIRGGLARIALDRRMLGEPASARRWVKQMRDAQAAADRDPFGFAFMHG